MALDAAGQPVSKVYISSQYRADPLGPATSITWEAPCGTLQTFDATVVTLQDISIPHTTWNVNAHTYP